MLGSIILVRLASKNVAKYGPDMAQIWSKYGEPEPSKYGQDESVPISRLGRRRFRHRFRSLRARYGSDMHAGNGLPLVHFLARFCLEHALGSASDRSKVVSLWTLTRFLSWILVGAIEMHRVHFLARFCLEHASGSASDRSKVVSLWTLTRLLSWTSMGPGWRQRDASGPLSGTLLP